MKMKDHQKLLFLQKKRIVIFHGIYVYEILLEILNCKNLKRNETEREREKR